MDQEIINRILSGAIKRIEKGTPIIEALYREYKKVMRNCFGVRGKRAEPEDEDIYFLLDALEF